MESKNINQYVSELEKENERLKAILKANKIIFEIPTKETLILKADISYRLWNVLAAQGFHNIKIGDLQNYKIKDLCKFNNMGRKSLTELKNLCKSCGFELKN